MVKSSKASGELVGYARVSTVEQNLEMQTQALNKEGCTRIFTDKLSAANPRREGWHDCKRYMRDGDTLVIYSLSRMARSVRELLQINKELFDRGIGLKSVTEPIDTRTADGALIFHVRAALAQFERDITIQRTKDGIAARRKAGLLIGRPRKLEDKTIRAIKRDLLAYNLTVKEICEKHKISKQLLSYHFPGGRQAVNARG